METEILVHLYIDRLRSKSVLGYLLAVIRFFTLLALYLCAFFIDVRLVIDVAVAMASPWICDVRLVLDRFFKLFLRLSSCDVNVTMVMCTHWYTHLLLLPIPENKHPRGKFVLNKGSNGSFFYANLGFGDVMRSVIVVGIWRLVFGCDTASDGVFFCCRNLVSQDPAVMRLKY